MVSRIERNEEALTLRFDQILLGYQSKMLDVSEVALPHEWILEEEVRLIYHHGQDLSLKDWIRSDPSPEEMVLFFRAVAELDEILDCFLLEEGRILFDPEWIEWNRETKKVRVVYSPFEPYALGAVPFWNRLAGYFHKALVSGLLNGEETIKAVFLLEQAAYKRQKKDPDWAMVWTLESQKEKEILPEETPIVTKEQREEALDELIKAHQEKEESPSLMLKRTWLKVKEKFPLVIKD